MSSWKQALQLAFDTAHRVRVLTFFSTIASDLNGGQDRDAATMRWFVWRGSVAYAGHIDLSLVMIILCTLIGYGQAHMALIP